MDADSSGSVTVTVPDTAALASLTYAPQMFAGNGTGGGSPTAAVTESAGFVGVDTPGSTDGAGGSAVASASDPPTMTPTAEGRLLGGDNSTVPYTVGAVGGTPIQFEGKASTWSRGGIVCIAALGIVLIFVVLY